MVCGMILYIISRVVTISVVGVVTFKIGIDDFVQFFLGVALNNKYALGLFFGHNLVCKFSGKVLEIILRSNSVRVQILLQANTNNFGQFGFEFFPLCRVLGRIWIQLNGLWLVFLFVFSFFFVFCALVVFVVMVQVMFVFAVVAVVFVFLLVG